MVHRQTSILEDRRFRFRKEEERGSEHRIDYTKKPQARRAWTSLILAILAWSLTAVSVRLSIAQQGNIDLNVSAVVFGSILFAIFGLFYGGISFREKKVRYLLSYIGILLNGIQCILWSMIIIMGGR